MSYVLFTLCSQAVNFDIPNLKSLGKEFLALLYPNVIDISLLGLIWLGSTMRAALRYGGKSG